MLQSETSHIEKKPRCIKVGYLDLLEDKFISRTVINGNFLRFLANYVKLITIPVNKRKDIKDVFSTLREYKLDYIYIDTFSLKLELFLFRERLGLDIPFIFTLHTVYPWWEVYIDLIPLIRDCDIICAPSEYAKESFSRISDKLSIPVIPYCLDTRFIQSNIPPDSKNDKKLITFMGRLIEEKGIGTLIKCMPEIIARGGNVHLNIIGPLNGHGINDKPKSSYVKELEETVRKLKLTNRVHFKGIQLGLNKYRLLSESDIFVSPTTAFEETFLMANFEALACAVPVITTDWAGNKELIKDGKNGFLIDVNYSQDKKPMINTTQLISMILKILRNKRLAMK